MNELKVSICQADLHWESKRANMAMFEEMIWSLEEETDLIVLPEMFTTGFSMNASKLAEPPGGETFKWMQMIAAQKKAAVTGSYIIKESGRFFNRLYFVLPDGSARYYDKKHLFTLAGEEKTYTPGTDKLIITYQGWKICPLICYDLRFPVWARSTRTEEHLYEYDLILYVANWPDARIHAWDVLLKARAIENLAYAVGVNRVGTDGFPKDYPGHSAMYTFKGEELVFVKEAGIFTDSLDYAALKTFRERYAFQGDADDFEFVR